MKILLTGSNGFLGSVILNKLKFDHEVFTLSRSNSDFNVDLSIVEPNINTDFDLVIHSSGKAHSLPSNYLEEKEFYNVNVKGTLNLLNALFKFKVPKYFIFISSVSVYGLIEGDLVSENTPLYAIDPYGKSKIEAEVIIKKWCIKHNVICTILRLPLVVGINPPGNLGSMIKAMQKGFYFNVSGGSAKKSMVLASDVAHYVDRVASVGGTYNLTDGYHPSFYELSLNIAEQIGNKFVPNLPKFVANFLALLGDLIGQKFPINSKKLQKITSTLTYDDLLARKAFDWNPTPVLKGFKINE